ncbi:winged helix-turn-helix domain-containing protein [Anaerofustis stercorihominis]|uniref:Stage 0 sporulation protein A homolog n=2 Tax=Anaerofustis stercorihominis TaxID=214853 RepID=B1C9A4_9FIRM|nr:response regulator transcription factor [Anaerofustis stercorihominis]EDS72268.1 response regulator receiver domain protein [Anaerofustis stercorihominis DSM 17244]MCQ4795133.1 response regulator transcription factor [Anaerofustis stercorihominis]RGD73191.1 DNA-binding response regulator [Anaerofustis stercorihominis]
MGNYIYVVEDDNNISELLKCSLEAFNYYVKVFENCEDMMIALKEEKPKLMLLDIMLPGMSGIDALKLLKNSNKYKSIPIIILSAKSSEIDKVNALELGADDYVTKPFSVLELSSRIKSVLRRSYKVEDNILNYKDITIDKENYLVSHDGEEVILTKKEYKILLYMLENKGRVVTREELLNEVWGYDFEGESRTLDMHMKTLRNKIGSEDDKYKYIKTIRGIGYKLG